ncbi:MAG TPA: DinB family protein [Thermoanaerobaculia bacterium]|nr:DinB family protein [Thermoanaerobaculia bacterium]
MKLTFVDAGVLIAAARGGSIQAARAMEHAVNHSTYHRGQVSTRIRQAGGTPIETDVPDFTGNLPTSALTRSSPAVSALTYGLSRQP